MKELVQVSSAHKSEWPGLAQAAHDYVAGEKWLAIVMLITKSRNFGFS